MGTWKEILERNDVQLIFSCDEDILFRCFAFDVENIISNFISIFKNNCLLNILKSLFYILIILDRFIYQPILLLFFLLLLPFFALLCKLLHFFQFCLKLVLLLGIFFQLSANPLPVPFKLTDHSYKYSFQLFKSRSFLDTIPVCCILKFAVLP